MKASAWSNRVCLSLPVQHREELWLRKPVRVQGYWRSLSMFYGSLLHLYCHSIQSKEPSEYTERTRWCGDARSRLTHSEYGQEAGDTEERGRKENGTSRSSILHYSSYKKSFHNQMTKQQSWSYYRENKFLHPQDFPMLLHIELCGRSFETSVK